MKKSLFSMIRTTCTITDCPFYCKSGLFKIDFFRSLEDFILDKPSFVLHCCGQTLYQYNCENDLFFVFQF
jgi:hypothetical protein